VRDGNGGPFATHEVGPITAGPFRLVGHRTLIKRTVNSQVFSALATCAGGEVISTDQF